jgi:hypothetical protein
MQIQLQRAFSPEYMLEEECGICAVPFRVESVVAYVNTGDAGVEGGKRARSVSHTWASATPSGSRASRSTVLPSSATLSRYSPRWVRFCASRRRTRTPPGRCTRRATSAS